MRAYLTPEAATGDYACRRFLIPVELLHIVTGALSTLTHPSSYEEFGTMTPTEAADLMLEVMNTYTTTEGDCETMAEIGIPHWRTFPPYPDTGDVVLCDGSAYLKSEYPDYWQAIVNTNHQGEWEVSDTQFIVPNMIEKFVRGTDSNPGNFDGYDEIVLTVAQLPAHTHAEQDPGSVVVQAGTGAVALSDPGLPSQTGSTGGGQAVPTIPAHTGLYPYIRLRGSVTEPAPPTVNRAGEIVPYLGTEPPEYTLPCDGSQWGKTAYPLLWAVLETELVGGVKVFEMTAETFKTPDYRGRTLIGYGQGTGLTNRIDPVASIGAETHVLTTAEMPAHTHTEEGIVAGSNTYQSGTNRPSVASDPQASGSAGGGGAHNNMQPSRATRYAIRYA